MIITKYRICNHYVYRKINEAAHEQIETLWHSTNIYQHPNIYQYAQKLVSTLPSHLKVNKNLIYFYKKFFLFWKVFGK